MLVGIPVWCAATTLRARDEDTGLTRIEIGAKYSMESAHE
jgi:hypothetical protein